MAKEPKKVQLECTRTNGRWNKGDKAGFEPETAERLLKAKHSPWKKPGSGNVAANPTAPKGGGNPPAGAAAG